MSKKAAVISVILVVALAAAYFSIVIVGNAVEERKYEYTSSLDYALDYLSNEPYSQLEIEVDHVAGYPPDRQALDFLVRKILEYTDKSRVYINWNCSDEIPLETATYNLSSMQALEHTYRDEYKHGDTAVLYILYLNGLFRDNGGIEAQETETVGLEYGFSSIAIFKQEILDYSGNPYLAEYMERSVLLHEFGHTICLVGIGYDSPQEDPEHPHHSIHKDGVMYYALNASAGIPPQDFCNDSKRDIETIKEHQREISPVIYVPWLLTLADILACGVLIFAVISHKEDQFQPPPYSYYQPAYSYDGWQEYQNPYGNEAEEAEEEDDIYF